MDLWNKKALAKAHEEIATLKHDLDIWQARVNELEANKQHLTDLAVHRDHQRNGIGKELIGRTKEAAPKARLILLSAPKAVEYYPRIGMTQWPQCYVLDRIEDLK